MSCRTAAFSGMRLSTSGFTRSLEASQPKASVTRAVARITGSEYRQEKWRIRRINTAART
jgi:hypothetical protein